MRKCTEIPYIAHVMSVSALVLENVGDEDCAIAGLLHDTVEDSEDGAAMEQRIRREFGDRVVGIVMGCSDTVGVPGQKKPAWRQRKERYLAHLREEAESDVLLVSACDKLHNARAIMADLWEIGPQRLWERFDRESDQVWYYTALVDAYPRDRIPASLRAELERTVDEMSRFAGSPHYEVGLTGRRTSTGTD